MDAGERRKLLFEKGTANNQRRMREELLSRLPSHLSGVLGDSPCIYSVDVDPILRQVFPFNPSGLGSANFAPPHYGYAEMSRENQALAWLPRLVVPQLAGRAFLLLQSPPECKFEGQCFYLPDLPLFMVDFRWAAPHLTELWEYSQRGLFLVEQDLKAGALIDTFSGILPEDPNPSEIGYEVALWPDRSA